MKVEVITVHPKGDKQVKETDLTRPGNCRWLIGHLKWAAKFGYSTTVIPL